MEIACIQWALRRYGHIPWRKHKQGLSVWKESSGTNSDSSAYYGGPWVTCIFKIKKNPDLSIVQKNVFQIVSIKATRAEIDTIGKVSLGKEEIVTKFNVYI